MPAYPPDHDVEGTDVSRLREIFAELRSPNSSHDEGRLRHALRELGEEAGSIVIEPNPRVADAFIRESRLAVGDLGEQDRGVNYSAVVTDRRVFPVMLLSSLAEAAISANEKRQHSEPWSRQFATDVLATLPENLSKISRQISEEEDPSECLLTFVQMLPHVLQTRDISRMGELAAEIGALRQSATEYGQAAVVDALTALSSVIETSEAQITSLTTYSAIQRLFKEGTEARTLFQTILVNGYGDTRGFKDSDWVVAGILWKHGAITPIPANPFRVVPTEIAVEAFEALDVLPVHHSAVDNSLVVSPETSRIRFRGSPPYDSLARRREALYPASAAGFPADDPDEEACIRKLVRPENSGQ